MTLITNRAKIKVLVEEKNVLEEKLKQAKLLPKKKAEKLFGKEGKQIIEYKIESIDLKLKKLNYVGHLDYIG